MANSNKFEKVRHFYSETGLWNINRVRNAVEKNWITKEQYYELTGEEYDSIEK
jgi:hypothetical protein